MENVSAHTMERPVPLPGPDATNTNGTPSGITRSNGARSSSASSSLSVTANGRIPGRCRTGKPLASVSVHTTNASPGSPSPAHGAVNCLRDAASPSWSCVPTTRRSTPSGAGVPLQL